MKMSPTTKKTYLLLFNHWVAPVLMGALIVTPIIYFSSPIEAESLIKNNTTINPLSKFAKKNSVSGASCSFKATNNQCFVERQALCEADMQAAKIAWKYFENNYQEKTGLFNAANKYPSTTMWDTGSALAATIAAQDFGLISKKEFDDKITALLKTLVTMGLFNKEAPNKVYNTKTMKMVTYGNKVTPDGIGVSVLDMARLISWLNTLSCKHPKFRHQVKQAMSRWKFDRLIKDGRMISLKRDMKTNEIKMFQEGRLGYEQYAAKIMQRNGLSLPDSSTYHNENKQNFEIYGITIATDNRTPTKFHSSNSVVTESYVMDAIENGFDEENTPLINNIYQVQKQRWLNEGIVTAVSEDNINKKPYFVYNTIFSGGDIWIAKSSKGDVLKSHKTVSTKAAIALALLYPNDEYSDVLIDKVSSAYDLEKGWYSGVYENGEGYNTSATANTNGVILSALLYKKYGSTHDVCRRCVEQKPFLKTTPSTCEIAKK
ncbi:MAG: DUF3131 domain-containing protein [Cocleimonas sp.]|nr:DUF3131 domain-containing protein [Cocleimonas sp.]